MSKLLVLVGDELSAVCSEPGRSYYRDAATSSYALLHPGWDGNGDQHECTTPLQSQIVEYDHSLSPLIYLDIGPVTKESYFLLSIIFTGINSAIGIANTSRGTL